MFGLAKRDFIGAFGRHQHVLKSMHDLMAEASTRREEIGAAAQEIVMLGQIARSLLEPYRTLYICRPVTNADEVLEWFRTQGVQNLTASDDLHVTIAYSRKKVRWNRMGIDAEEISLRPSKFREMDRFGEAVVLRFQSSTLQSRWGTLIQRGASWEHPAYCPHITITYSVDLNADSLNPYIGRILLGPEQFNEIVE